ncbi:P2Y purinoceptor 14-like [Oryzias latipes]|uniref:P2Y purinoceptor 14-like n=1 Tax=Oryzias latipes TaxID=8090 RepID=UPI0002A48D85|nr:P2Y purinoceptor 14-like [Oryzias latipes]
MNNSTELQTSLSDYGSVFTKNVLPVLYSVIFVVGLSLNGVAAWIFFRVPAESGLVVYLKNMVVADLFMLGTFPFRIMSELGLGSWYLPVIMCRYSAVLFYFSMYVGIIFICFISLERYVKIIRHTPSPTASSSCRPRFGVLCSLQLMQSSSFAWVLAFFTWSLLLLIVLPNVLLTNLPANEQNSRDCMKLKTPLGKLWHKASTFFFVSLFWLTLLVLAFCYTSIAHRLYKSYQRVRQDTSAVCRKSNRSIYSILAVFFICFVPYHVFRIPYTLCQMTEFGFSWYSHFVLFQLKEATLFLSALNVCLDPIIYFLMCRIFRESLLRKLSRKERRSRSQTTTAVQSVSSI